MSRSHRKSDEEKMLGKLIFLFLSVLLLPILGIKLMGSESVSKIALGLLLTVVGIVVWIMLLTA